MISWFYQSLEEDQCSGLGEPSTAQFVVSCGLIGWVLVCYIPQWARIVSRKSSEGISALYILLGSLSGVCAVGNIMMLPSSIVAVGCCKADAPFTCINNLLGIFQVIFGISCFWIVLFMFYYYSREEVNGIALHKAETHNRSYRRTPSLQARQILLVSNGFAVLIFIVSAIILRYFPQVSQTWADILGVSLAIGACFQWLPQIVTTWRLGHLGSLSSASLCFLTPYTWIFGINMIVRVGTEGWSAWIIYVLVGIMQLVLLGFAVFFRLQQSAADYEAEYEIRRDDKVDLSLQIRAEMTETTDLHADERCPLLGSSKPET